MYDSISYFVGSRLPCPAVFQGPVAHGLTQALGVPVDLGNGALTARYQHHLESVTVFYSRE